MNVNVDSLDSAHCTSEGKGVTTVPEGGDICKDAHTPLSSVMNSRYLRDVHSAIVRTLDKCKGHEGIEGLGLYSRTVGLGLGLGCCKRVKRGGKRPLGLGFRSDRRRRPVPGRGSGRPFGAQLWRHSDAAAPPRCRLSALVPVLVRLRSGDFSLQKC